MVLELLLLSVLLVAGYNGQLLYRRGPRAGRATAYLLFADAFVALIAYAGVTQDEPPRGVELLGVVAVGAFVCLVLVPPLLRDVARRAVEADKLHFAARLQGLRELLQPGLGARQEQADVQMFAAIRAGQDGALLAELEQAQGSAPTPELRAAAAERIVLVHLYARRWADATGAFERVLEPRGAASPQLLVEVVRAYLEQGAQKEAGALLARLDAAPALQHPFFAALRLRARLMFLAFLGRLPAVEALVDKRGPLAPLPPAVKSFWRGVALANAGDVAGARTALEKATKTRDARGRELAASHLERLAAVTAPPARTDDAETLALADNLGAEAIALAEAAPAAGALGQSSRTPYVTMALIAVNVAAALLMRLALGAGSSEEAGALALAGANVRAEVADGALWRLIVNTFLHVGPLHLFLNMYMLWQLGRLEEPLFGRARFLAIYVLAGVGGSVASHFFGTAGLSAGASGAVFGVLGALLVELLVRRQHYPPAWRSALVGNLIFVVLSSVGAGLLYPMIDQAAHVGGAIVGAALGALLSPRGGLGKLKVGRHIAATFAIAAAGLLVFGAVGLARGAMSSSWRRVPLPGGASIEVPPRWSRVDTDAFVAPGYRVNALRVRLALAQPGEAGSTEALGAHAAAEIDADLRSESRASSVEIVPDGGPRVDGWALVAHRLDLSFAEGEATPYRNLAYVRVVSGVELGVFLLTPESRRAEVEAFVPHLLASFQLPDH